MQTEKYFHHLSEEIKRGYDIANGARALGYDPVNHIEIPLATNLAEKVVGLISTLYPQINDPRIVKRIGELEKEYGTLDIAVCLKIAEEIAKEKFCKFDSLLQAIEAGIRVGFAYTTLGVVSSPIEGFTFLKLNKTKDGKEYFQAYFSGPIRSAGTTASCVVLMITDYLRETFGFAKYDPDEKEIKRTAVEILDFHERITNLQYCPTEEEALFLAEHIPIQVAGEPSEKLEVSNFKDLPRVDTNFLRSGFCLILAEGMAQKAPKALRILKGLREKGFKLTDWDFLEEYCKIHEKRTKGSGDSSPTYMKDMVAGRPIFGHPSRSGAFRFRYGRSRVAGFSAASMHPATMAISDNFIAVGTQLKIEKPTKGCVVSVCDSIDGPIVKFKDGSVKQIRTFEETKGMYKDVEEIIYAGDILFPFGDLANRNQVLIKPGYVEEWWNLELEKVGQKVEDYYNVDFEKAIELSKEFRIPLYPKYIFYWNQISYEQFLEFLRWLSYARLTDNSGGYGAFSPELSDNIIPKTKQGSIYNEKIILPYSSFEREKFVVGKRALELLGIEHDIGVENVIISEIDSRALFANLGVNISLLEKQDYFIEKEINALAEKVVGFAEKNVLEVINLISEFVIKDKAGEFIGSRMGRPEKAKLRKLTGDPHTLFPVGEEGGRFRSVQEACTTDGVFSDFPIYYCEKCKKDNIYPSCVLCGGINIKKFFCRACNKEMSENNCEEHGKCQPYSRRKINIKEYFNYNTKMLGLENGQMPALVKGVRGMSSAEHLAEPLAKGILRASLNLNVNKDGTIRYDMTELPITHFKPKEIFVSIEKLKEIGYTLDIYGKELVDDEQVLELMPHDIILPCSSESGDERADEVFINLAKFIDLLLVKFYGLEPFYNVKKREDLVGHLGVCMAPHNCAGVIARIVGFSKTQGLLASPYMHAAMRRDCFYPTTKFVYLENNKIKTEAIGKYAEDLINSGAKTKKIDACGTERIELDKEIYALGAEPGTMKLKKKKIKYFIKTSAPEKWVKIKTASGREQTMTSTHRIAYLDKENNFKTKKAEEFKVGDKIALVKNLNLPLNKISKIESLDLLEILLNNVPQEHLKKIRLCECGGFFREFVCKISKKRFCEILKMPKNKKLSDWYKRVPLSDIKILINYGLKLEDIPKNSTLRTIFNNKKWDLKLKIDNNLMSVLGYYSAEGYSRQNKTVSQVCFRIMDSKQRIKLAKAIEGSFGILPSFGEDKTKITIGNKMVYYLFKYYFKAGEGAYRKKVPDIVFNVSDELVKEYLSAYFDGDGTILCSGEGKSPRKAVVFYSVSRELLDGVSLLGAKFGLFGRFAQTKERLPGKKVLERYAYLKKEPKTHILNHLTYSGRDFFEIAKILSPENSHKKELIAKAVSEAKNYNVKDRKAVFLDNYLTCQELPLKEEGHKNITSYMVLEHCQNSTSNLNHLSQTRRILKFEEKGDIIIDFIKDVVFFEEKTPSYCFEIEWESEADKNVLWGEQILNARCDGDEAAAMLLLDVLINFSKAYLPGHRGGTQDAPLVLNGRIVAGEVDDQILDFEVVDHYPLELYEAAERGEHSSKVKIEMVKNRIKEEKDPFRKIGYTHETNDFNKGVLCSSYKQIPTMSEKVEREMELVRKLRAVDTSDVARLIIERHFIRDIRGNLIKFSSQGFRCVKCNSKFRRPPLSGVCLKCGGKIIFTINEGGIVKYLEPALALANNYDVPVYVKQNIELTKRYIESVFGREETKQVDLKQWFG